MTDSTQPDEFETFDLAHVVDTTGAPSQDWLMRRIRRGDLTARKAGRHWRMTRRDMAEVVAFMERPAKTADVAPVAQPRRTGLTERARRSLARTA